MLNIERIHHIAILTSTELYETCKQFYTDILGFTVVAEVFRKERNSYKLDLALNGLYQIELFSFTDDKERASYPEAKGLSRLAVGVENVNEGYKWLVSKHVKVEEVRTDEFTRTLLLFFYDPNGPPL